jgi:unsaturated chondroitin disaccharide hydrolase
MAAYASALEFAEQQVAAIIQRHPDYFPIYTRQGKWFHEGPLWTDWTGGFLAGMMWRFHRWTRDPAWLTRAEHYSRLLEPRKLDGSVHDLGFIFLNSYRPWHELTGDPAIRAVVHQAGRTLARRYMPKGRYLCSFIGPQSLFIDIMMNVPLIFYTAKETGDGELYQLALAHCRTTRSRLLRPDGSTAHEGLFDPATGRFLRQCTHQGLSGQSTWARGLAWSLYGFSQVYALTGLAEFLAAAEENAAYWLAHLPGDMVPYWDFDADLGQPLPWGPQKDSSAAAIAASGLLDLARQTASPEHAIAYHNAALVMLDALSAPDYLARQTPGWEGILKHGVYHTRKNLGVDESVMWGDFYLVEALSKVLESGRST